MSNAKVCRERITISDEDLAARLERITPLVLKDGKPRRFKIPDTRNTAFTMKPENVSVPVPVEIIAQTRTQHLSSPFFFKPSIAEVLAQVPEDWEAKGINAFYLDASAFLNTLDDGFDAECVWCSIDNSGGPFAGVIGDEFDQDGIDDIIKGIVLNAARDKAVSLGHDPANPLVVVWSDIGGEWICRAICTDRDNHWFSVPALDNVLPPRVEADRSYTRIIRL